MDYDNTRHKKSFQIFATDRDDAMTISKELFYMDVGVASEMTVSIDPVELSDIEYSNVNRKFFEVYGVLKENFAGMNYKSFVKSYEDFEGKYFRIQSNIVSYVITFRGVTCKVVYDNSSCRVFIDESEVVFHTDNRDYILRNNLCDIFIGG
jgi:hypothetical protein